MASRQVNGATIRALRDALGVSQAVLARDAVLSPGYLCKIEKGRQQPEAAVARRIADRLGVALDAITYPVADSADVDGPPFRISA